MKIHMNRKISKLQSLTFGLKLVVVIETVAFVGSYLLWRKMNKDRDFRYKVHQRMPFVLDYYYKVGEKLGGHATRETDYIAWGIKQ